MKQPNVDEDTEVDDLPASPLLAPVRGSRYGTVAELDEDELADPDELERVAIREAFGPIWLLPAPAYKDGIRPTVDEDGHIEFGAFGSVDWERTQPAFDKAQYKADRLREELKNVVIGLQILNERVQVPGKFRVLGLVRKGRLDVDDIVHFDLWLLARMYLRVIRQKQEIARLEQESRERRERQAQAFWARYDD